MEATKYKPGEPFKTAKEAVLWMAKGESWAWKPRQRCTNGDEPGWMLPRWGMPEITWGDIRGRRYAPAIPIEDEQQPLFPRGPGTGTYFRRLPNGSWVMLNSSDLWVSVPPPDKPHPTLGMTKAEQKQVLALLAKARHAFNAYEARPYPLMREVDDFLAQHCYKPTAQNS